MDAAVRHSLTGTPGVGGAHAGAKRHCRAWKPAASPKPKDDKIPALSAIPWPAPAPAHSVAFCSFNELRKAPLWLQELRVLTLSTSSMM